MVTKILAPTAGIFRDVLQVETNLRIPSLSQISEVDKVFEVQKKGFLPSRSRALDVVVPPAVATI